MAHCVTIWADRCAQSVHLLRRARDESQISIENHSRLITQRPLQYANVDVKKIVVNLYIEFKLFIVCFIYLFLLILNEIETFKAANTIGFRRTLRIRLTCQPIWLPWSSPTFSACAAKPSPLCPNRWALARAPDPTSSISSNIRFRRPLKYWKPLKRITKLNIHYRNRITLRCPTFDRVPWRIGIKIFY